MRLQLRFKLILLTTAMAFNRGANTVVEGTSNLIDRAKNATLAAMDNRLDTAFQIRQTEVDRIYEEAAETQRRLIAQAADVPYVAAEQVAKIRAATSL